MDYTIFTKAVASRLQTVLPQIISPDQTGLITKRFIGSNLRTVQDVIEVAREREEQAFLLALDYRKAFDTIQWELVFRALVLRRVSSTRGSLHPTLPRKTV